MREGQVTGGSPSLLRTFRRCPCAYLAPCRPFIVADRHVGWVKPHFAQLLAEYPAVVYLTDREVHLQERLAEAAHRSAAVADVMAKLRDRGAIPGWRGELYPVNRRFGETPLLL